MPETSYDGDIDEPDTQEQPDDEGSYEEPGAYSNADGTTGYAGLTSGEVPDHGEESGDYPASVGAAIAVGGIVIELGGAGVAAGLEAEGIITAGMAEGADLGMFVGFRVIEGIDAIWGE